MRIGSKVCAVGLLLAASSPAAAQTPAGEAFTVNTTVIGEKSRPDVAVGPDGRFVVAWRAEELDGDGWGVAARWYDPSGVALTGEVQVNSVAVGRQAFYGIDNDGQGNSVIVWLDVARGVIARRFDTDGLPLSDEVIVSPAANALGVAVSVNAGGRFLVSWLRADSSTRDVEARRFGADGLPLGGVFAVTSFTHTFYSEESVVVLRDDDSFLVGWSDGEEVSGRLYDSVGNPITGGFQISQLDPMSTFSFQLDAGCEDTGRYRVFWATDLNLEEGAPMTRTVDPTGALGALTQLDFLAHGAFAFSLTGHGEFVVTRSWLWGHEIDGARFDGQHTLLSVFDIEQDAGPGFTLRNGRVAHGGVNSLELVTVWINQPLPGGPPFAEIRARQFRRGLFADGFESGDTDRWSLVVP